MLKVQVRHQRENFQLDVDFTTAKTGVTALYGRSGAGKTTLINFIAGLERPDSGYIAVAGKVLLDSAKSIDVPPERRGIGYVFQDDRLFPHLKVRGNLRYGMSSPDRGHFDRIISLLELEPLLQRNPRDLSGGERQRVAIGRALLAQPNILLLDEPLTGVDRKLRENLLTYIEKLPSEIDIPVVYVSHSVEEVMRLADYLVIVENGGVAVAGIADDVMNQRQAISLLGGLDAGTILSAQVSGDDPGYGLSRLKFGGGTLLVPHLDLPPASRLRIRIAAKDVSLALVAPEKLSVLNVFSGIVQNVSEGVDAHVDVVIDIGCLLRARLTRKSVDQLSLSPGTPIFALVKSVALNQRSIARPVDGTP